MNKKFIGLLLIVVIFIAGCQTEELNNDEYLVPETNDVIVSPELPDKIVVHGKEVSVVEGNFLKPSQYINDGELIKPTDTFDTMELFSFSEIEGMKVLHIVPSLDTPVCSLQTRQLDHAATELPDVNFITISADLPFALKRFVEFNEISNMKVYSDFQTNNFLKSNKLFLEDYHLATRAIIILNEDNQIMYVEYAKEVTEELDLFNAINFLRQNHTS